MVDRVDRQDIVDMLAHQIKYDQAAKESEIGVVGSAASHVLQGYLGYARRTGPPAPKPDDPSMIGPATGIGPDHDLYGSLSRTSFLPGQEQA